MNNTSKMSTTYTLIEKIDALVAESGLSKKEMAKIFLRGTRKTSANTPEQVWQALLPTIAGAEKEMFFVLSLNVKNKIIKIDTVSIGTLTQTLVGAREVFRSAILSNAANIIIAHNHPSGETQPSVDDINATRKLKEAGSIIGIEVLDHVIVTDGDYYSMRQNREGGF